MPPEAVHSRSIPDRWSNAPNLLQVDVAQKTNAEYYCKLNISRIEKSALSVPSTIQWTVRSNGMNRKRKEVDPFELSSRLVWTRQQYHSPNSKALAVLGGLLRSLYDGVFGIVSELNIPPIANRPPLAVR